MNVRHRYVPYGTHFVPAEGNRINGENAQSNLHENELAMDVGGTCWGYANEVQAVIDHHFFRPDLGQFPSASAAVLHKASDICKKFAVLPGDLWLVSHRQPDFDAYCSMYLARCLVLGEILPNSLSNLGLKDDGWFGGPGEINWYDPDVRMLSREERWPILLAAYASLIDQCRRLSCPKERALHSVLYAASIRGRGYDDERSGALEFLNEVREALIKKQLNPLYDSVLEGNSTFAPELR